MVEAVVGIRNQGRAGQTPVADARKQEEGQLGLAHFGGQENTRQVEGGRIQVYEEEWEEVQ